MNYPLMGKLIDGKASYKWIVDNSINVAGIVSICSAFLRSSILVDFSKRLPKDTLVRVIARWRLEDLLAGASDLESYEVCKKMGWDFYICINFHGKVFDFPPNGILVGSANATCSGFGLLSNSNSNSEVCTVVKGSEVNNSLVEGLFLSSTRMTDELFLKLKSIYHDSLKKNDAFEWPESIFNEISLPKDFDGKLFLSECLLSNGDEIINSMKCESVEARSDASLLSLPSGQFDPQVIAARFAQTKIFYLLRKILASEGGEVYFGTLTAVIHSHLMQDPVPYRSDVKKIVRNLYSWVSYLGSYLSMDVDRPNYSERIRILT